MHNPMKSNWPEYKIVNISVSSFLLQVLHCFTQAVNVVDKKKEKEKKSCKLSQNNVEYILLQVNIDDEKLK